MDLKIEGRVAVLTGGDSGIGKATAKLLVAEGVTVILSDLPGGDLDGAAEEVKPHAARGGSVAAVAADLTSDSDLSKLAKAAEAAGGCDILAHFAGARGAAGPFLELTDDDWRATIEVDLLGAVRVCRTFIPHMRKKGWGRVLLTASENALQPYPEESPYNACKAGVINLAKGLSKDYGPDGVRVNVVSPAYIATPMTDKMMDQLAEEKGISKREAIDWFLDNKRPGIVTDRRGKPEEVAGVAALLCSEWASYVNGSNYRVDGGAVMTAFG